MLPFRSTTFASPRAGSRLIVLGAVHGNEVCGTRAIQRLLQELETGVLTLSAGVLTLVPVTNPLAYEKRQRNGDRNLNRRLTPTTAPREFEDHVANWLCPLLARHDTLLDLHSFQAGDMPFVLVGPENNTGPIEPFAHAHREEALALRLGVQRAVEGWLSCYADGANRREGGDIAAWVLQGTGTTEYMRSVGGWGLTLECGQHDDPQAPEVAYRAILNTLAHLQMIDAADPAPSPKMEGLRMCEVFDKRHADDRFARPWKGFDPVASGERIGTRHDGAELVAPFAGRMLFPKHDADVGQEWFYLAKPSTRLTR